ncbi:MAG: 2-oxoacid:acceptor oxidoreductase family protein [Carboxydocellales bacterium]
MAKAVKIVLAGEGGQGVQSVAEILAEAANTQGREALYIPNFGVEQRGGVSVAYLQISDDPIGSPKFQKGDIVVALSERAVLRSLRYVDERTTFVYDTSIEGIEDQLPKNAGRILAIPAIDVSKKEFSPRVFNILILGAVLGATGVVPLDQVKAAIEAQLGYKFQENPKLREMNFGALERGIDLVQKAQ